jgi:hypothetical protein
MEIHAPDKPILTIKETAEDIRDNRNDLRAVRTTMEAMLEKLTDAVDGLSRRWDEAAATAVFAAPGPQYVMYNCDLATADSASHVTAQTTGALWAQTAAALDVALVRKP